MHHPPTEHSPNSSANDPARSVHLPHARQVGRRKLNPFSTAAASASRLSRAALWSLTLLPWALASDAAGQTQPAAAAQSATGQTASAAKPEPSAFERIWGYSKWYSNKENPVIQSVVFTGRLQYDFAVIDQNDFDTINMRRWRMGTKIKAFKDFMLQAEVDFDLDEDPIYQRLTEVSVSWSRSPELEITLGKQGAPFTLDGSTSSKELLTIDRSNLANNLWFPEEYMPGLSAAGEVGHWVYHAAIHSSGSRSGEFGNFDGSWFLLSSIGYDFKDALDSKEALLSFNYVFQDPDIDNTFTRRLHHVGSVNFRYAEDNWGVRADLSGGLGYLGQSDLWAFSLMPYYNLTSKLQLVARYTFLDSEDPDGVRFARYESEAVPSGARGDAFHEYYAGLNYYIYGHKLKLQTGVHYAEMNDNAGNAGAYTGWGWTTGLRLSW